MYSLRIRSAQFWARIQNLLTETVTGVEKQYFFAFELPCVDLCFVLPSMPDRHHRFERFVVECLGENARLVKRQGNHDHIQFSVFQHGGQIDREGFFDFEGHSRRAFVKRRDQIRQDVGSDRGDDAESQRSSELIFALGGKNLDLIRFLQHALGLMNDPFPQRGQRNLVPSPLKNRCAQIIFQLLDGQAQGRLSHKDPLSGTPKMALLRHGDDILEFCQGHPVLSDGYVLLIES